MKLMPSEVMVLCADQFVDNYPSQDASTERPLAGTKKVNAERLAVALIRAAILSNDAMAVSTLVWRSSDALKKELEEIVKVTGVGGQIIGALSRADSVQTALNQPKPWLQDGPVSAPWPAGTLEAYWAEPTASGDVGVAERIWQLKNQWGAGAGIVRHIKQRLVSRGLLEPRRRGFGWLMPGFRVPDATRHQLISQLPTTLASVQRWQQGDPVTWNRLNESITIALRSGIS
jgi:hypothetical protein